MPKTVTQSTYVFGPFRLTPAKRQLQDADDRPVALGGKVFDLLRYLIEHRGRLVGKTELLEAVWPGMVVEENNLNQAISALRQALGDDTKAPEFVATVKGRGYQFIGDVHIDDVDIEQASEDSDAKTMTGVPPRRSRPWPALLSGAAIAIAGFLWLVHDPEPALPATPVVEHFANATLSLVTDFPGSHSEPALSPNGRMLAYISDVSGTPQIWVRNLQRGDPIQITDGPYAVRSLSWSPNDDQILFSRNSLDGTAIYSVGTLGRPKARMVVEHAGQPNYSRHANAFVFSRAGEIWVARNDGRDTEKVVGVPVGPGFAPLEPALSPDGKRVAFIHADEGPMGNVWVIPSAGGEARQLTTIETNGGIATSPEWSVDGRFIIYSVEANTGGGHLWRVNIDTGEAEALTTGASGGSDAAISAAGNRMAYTVTRIIWRLTRLNPLTAETTLIHSSRTPVILPVASPDGERIVFFSRNATGMQLFMIDSDGDDLQQLTFDEPGKNSLPTWAGDGQSILYYRDRSLHQLDPADGSDTEIFSDFHWSTRNWLNAHGDRITYHKKDLTAGPLQTVVRGMTESAEIELPVPIEGAQWSTDGKELLGWFRQTGELLICNVEQATCRNIVSEGSNVTSAYYAMWSNDGQQIYFLAGTNELECCALWRVDSDGSNKKFVAELTGFQGQNGYYGVDANGDIFYNHLDRSTDEIWLAESNE
ncbi:MAG: LpqB family beta-propeller domain-containing protein [Woeseiaceae bacterium]